MIAKSGGGGLRRRERLRVWSDGEVWLGVGVSGGLVLEGCFRLRDGLCLVRRGGWRGVRGGGGGAPIDASGRRIRSCNSAQE